VGALLCIASSAAALGDGKKSTPACSTGACPPKAAVKDAPKPPVPAKKNPGQVAAKKGNAKGGSPSLGSAARRALLEGKAKQATGKGDKPAVKPKKTKRKS
jgi:hypothetical protein